MKIKGIWLFGLSGSGKTYLSKKIAKQIKNSFLIDGDQIRKWVSFDLGYNIRDRVTSSKRNLGLAKIAIANKQFPIISGVYLDPKVYKDICKSKHLDYTSVKLTGVYCLNIVWILSTRTC